MTDMPKPQYLAKDNKGYKLRRNVPPRYRDAIGKTAWVERLSGMTYPEMCDRAKVFGVETDLALKGLSNISLHTPQKARMVDEPRFTLTNVEISQLKLVYFRRLEQSIDAAGGYVAGLGDLNDADFLEHLEYAQHDYLDALAVAEEMSGKIAISGEHGPAQSKVQRQKLELDALRLLSEHHFVEVERQRDAEKKAIGGLLSQESFQRLCNNLADAKAEHCRRRLSAFEKRRPPILQRPELADALDYSKDLNPRPAKTVGDLIDAYVDKKQGTVTKSRFNQYQLAIRALEEVKWSQETGQSAKVYHKPLKGYENGKAPELYRSV